ncbi:MAG: hypothetical protein GEU82_18460 [Luteitalea sp.]|nr:hypothetical protein [Luteitalea sp.]
MSQAQEGTLKVSIPVYRGEASAIRVRVELYADARNGGEPFVQQMTPIGSIPDIPNAFIYRATIHTARPAADFTVRAVPFRPEDACRLRIR